MLMDEIWVAIIGLIIALAIVGIIHWLLVGHVNIGSDTNKVILSLEVVAFVCLMATFVLGELFKIAETVLPGHNDSDSGCRADLARYFYSVRYASWFPANL